MPVIGTAGHVDHGKSTLVHALTGRDPDRWQEEKDRGLTIDLGFAWTTLPDGTEISFVDVPGHERFIKNMLAGTDGFDVALLVVAADEGWMPQSEEHLAVLDLLGITRAVVALTKVDRVDAELAELASLEVEDHLAGTGLEGAPIVAVSAVEGVGLDDLRSSLAQALEDIEPTHSDRPRLWVDRAFTITGAGTVVTGTLVGGGIEVGDQIELHPGPLSGRVRSLQTHESDRQSAAPGSRVAVNVVGLERDDVARGAMLGRPGHWAPSDRILVSLQRARYVDEPLTNRGAFHLHLGSGAWPVRLRALGTDDAGTEIAILSIDDPVPVQMGDRFVLREVGRRSIVAGGRVLEPRAPRRGDAARQVTPKLERALELDSDGRAAALLDRRGIESAATLAAHSGGGKAATAVSAGRMVMAAEQADRLAGAAIELTRAYHDDNPLRPGIPKASLASQLDVDQEALAAVLAMSAALEERGSAVVIVGFEATLGADLEAEWIRIESELDRSGLAVPRIKELGIDPELLHVLLREKRLVRISEDLAFLPRQLDELVARLEGLPSEFTVAEFRDSLGVTRKYAVPLLEWLDAQRITTRSGDTRSLA